MRRELVLCAAGFAEAGMFLIVFVIGALLALAFTLGLIDPDDLP